ncbi:MAG: glycosyltransferase [Gemmatimonadota bacterium]
MSTGPRLSVVLVATDGAASAKRTMEHLERQTAREEIELLLIEPEPGELSGLPLDRYGETFGRFRLVCSHGVRDPDEAIGAGIRGATAPVVALVEDHAYPEPEWASALLEAHRGPWVAVGSTLVNANPDRALSWANLLISYGRWAEPVAGGEIDVLPGHNVSYKREALLEACGRRDVASLFGRNGGLHGILREAGGRFHLERQARIQHLNVSRVLSTIRLRYDAGRVYGAFAAREIWSTWERLKFLVLGPLVPLVDWMRNVRGLASEDSSHLLRPSILVALAFAHLLDGFGQMHGNILGAGRAPERLAAFEICRPRHVTRTEREELGV